MATVTALRASGRASVAVELDGTAWRTLPLEAVVRAGLTVGCELDRSRARTLARERRRLAALGVAIAAVRHRDRSEDEVRRRLDARGVAAGERDRTLGTLRAAGVLDDARFAAGRAESLASRGYGDAAIRDDLERRGVGGGEVDTAIALLAPEHERAAIHGERLGGGVRAARTLARRGFGDEALEALVAAGGDAELG